MFSLFDLPKEDHESESPYAKPVRRVMFVLLAIFLVAHIIARLSGCLTGETIEPTWP